jgi:hypothetical protein
MICVLPRLFCCARPALLIAWLVGSAVLVGGTTRVLQAQDVPPASASVTSAAVSAARAAQDAFERNRRAGLRFYNGGGNATCEVQIGTLCYWNNNGDVPPPAERADVVIERGRLLETLAAAAEADPRDDWVAGMRVRYALEHQEGALAIDAARACGGSAWWCEALRGLAYHVNNQHVNATSAFDRALRAMPDSTRCVWTDLTPWLPPSAHAAYSARVCADRGSENARILHLAQPLWMLPSNDARNELLARHTISVVHGQGRIPYDMPWDGSIAAMQVRYGWPTAWSMQTAGALDRRLPSIIGHEPTPSYDFMPSPGAIANPLSATADDWDPLRKDARMRYATRYASGFAPLPHQLARFRRGDSTVLAGAWRLMREQRMGPAPYRAGLFLADTDAQIVQALVQDSVPANGALLVPMGNAPRLVSLEVIGEKAQRATRVRAAIAPLTAGSRISDLLLLVGGDAGAAPTLEQVVRRAWGSNDIEPGRAFGLYWESYAGASPDAPLQVTVRATRTNSNFSQRITNALRLSRAMTPVALSFRDPGRPDGGAGRAVQFTWPEVPPGDYRLTVMITGAGIVDSSSQLVTVREKR